MCATLHCAGKTTLLNALANHVPAKSGMKLSGRVVGWWLVGGWLLVVGSQITLLVAVHSTGGRKLLQCVCLAAVNGVQWPCVEQGRVKLVSEAWGCLRVVCQGGSAFVAHFVPSLFVACW